MLVQNALVSSESFIDVAAQLSFPLSWQRRLIEALELALAAAGTYRRCLVTFHLALRIGLTSTVYGIEG